LIFAATFYLLFALFSTQETAYMETLTIYCGVLFASLIAATADWIKERQYLKIKDEINNAHAIVFRGQYGSTISVPIRDLVVGDVIDIQ
jgi:magnesium-transporting ATPase (P-type)